VVGYAEVIQKTAFWEARIVARALPVSTGDFRAQRWTQITLRYEGSENPKLEPPASN
jgi:hypothetical protein